MALPKKPGLSSITNPTAGVAAEPARPLPTFTPDPEANAGLELDFTNDNPVDLSFESHDGDTAEPETKAASFDELPDDDFLFSSELDIETNAIPERGESKYNYDIIAEEHDDQSVESIEAAAAKAAKKAAEDNDNLYHPIGELTAEQVITVPFSRYAHLQDIIKETTVWIQDTLQEKGLSDAVGVARRTRDHRYLAMVREIDRLILRRITAEGGVSRSDTKPFVASVVNEILGFGPIEPLWQNPDISEIMVNGPFDIRVEVKGKPMRALGVRFRDAEHLLAVSQQMLGLIGRRIDVQNPKEDGQLPDGSRVNIVHTELAPSGPIVTIRRFPDTVFSIKKLVETKSMTEEMAVEIGNLVHMGNSIVIVGGTGSGKDLALDTTIPTPTGKTTMGELKVGDKVLDEDGLPCTVTGYFPQPLNQCYEIKFSDGTKVVAGKDHNWFTSTRNSRRAVSRQETDPKMMNAVRNPFATAEEIEILVKLAAEAGRWTNPGVTIAQLPRLRTLIYNATKGLAKNPDSTPKFALYDSVEFFTEVLRRASGTRDQRHKSAVESVVTTKEIYDTLQHKSGHANHAVKLVSQPVLYAEQDLAVSPYAFGAWLGDGTTATGAIGGIDDEIFENIISEGNIILRDNYPKVPEGHKPFRIVKFENFLNNLRTIGLGGKNQKFIPDAYLYSSVAQRRALIAGMLDTDGTVSKITGVIQFANSNKALIDGFRQVIHSLGYQSTVTSKIPTYKHKGEKLNGKRAYVVSFFTGDDVFGISRKAEIHRSVRNDKQRGHRSEYRYIVDCVPVESVPTACITVDSPNHLFLCTDSFIVTHNTSFLNAVSGCIPDTDRIITVEDTLELRLNPNKHVVALQARPSSSAGTGGFNIRDLVKNTLRMRPDRIIVGEVRDSSAYDMLQAMNTGHEGSLTTVHANNAEGAVERIALLVSEAGEIGPDRALSLIAGGVDLFVVIERYEDGSRRVKGIYEVPSHLTIEGNKYSLNPIPLFEFVHDSTDEDGTVRGHYEKMNDISESLIRKHRIDKKHRLTLEEIYKISDVEIPGE